MDVFEAVQQRKSIRSYQDKPIAHETLERILEAARLSPSAVNRQPWHFIVVTEKAKRKALSRGAFAKFLTQGELLHMVHKRKNLREVVNEEEFGKTFFTQRNAQQ